MLKKSNIIVFIVFALCNLQSTAKALPLPNQSVDQILGSNSHNSEITYSAQSAEDYSNKYSNTANTTGSIYLSTDTPKVSTESISSSTESSLSRTYLSYNFEIIGPNSYVPVTIDSILFAYTGQYDLTQSFNGSASSAFSLTSGGSNYIAHTVSVSMHGSEYIKYLSYSIDHFNVSSSNSSYSNFGIYETNTDDILLESNKIYTITLTSFASSSTNSSSISYSDPYIEIDSSKIDSDQYTLIFSPGVNNIKSINSPVPEPTSMLLFSTGIVSLAAIGRKRRVPPQRRRFNR